MFVANFLWRICVEIRQGRGKDDSTMTVDNGVSGVDTLRFLCDFYTENEPDHGVLQICYITKWPKRCILKVIFSKYNVT